jgi:hypothetical protein
MVIASLEKRGYDIVKGTVCMTLSQILAYAVT